MEKYWTAETTAALKQYQLADADRRNVIFEQTLLPALEKMVECILNMSSKYSAVDINQLRLDTISHLVSYLDRIDCSRNPFGYLTMCCKHFVYQYCKKQHTLDTRDISLNIEDKHGDDCIDLLESQLEISYDNNPIVGEDANELLKKVLDYWTITKIKQTLNCIDMCTHKRNRVLNAIKYSLYKLGSPHISFNQLNRNFQKQKSFSPRTMSGYLNFLAKESKRQLIDG